MLISPLNAFPWVVNGLMEALTSLNRLEKFLSIEDVELDDYYDDIPEDDEGKTEVYKIFSYQRLCLLYNSPQMVCLNIFQVVL